MVSNNQSCYDRKVLVVPSTPHCDYSTSFRCAIRERSPCFPVFNTYVQTLTADYHNLRRGYNIWEMRPNFKCRKSPRLQVKTLNFRPNRTAYSLYSSPHTMDQAFCCGISLSISGLITGSLGPMGYVVDKVPIEQAFLRVLQFFVVTIIPISLHTCLFIYHRHYTEWRLGRFDTYVASSVK